MDKESVAKAWVWSGLEDLHFGSLIVFDPHRPYKLFNEILALEKVMKALLLYYESNKYEHLSKKESKDMIEFLAKRHGHNIKKMLKKASKYFGKAPLDKLKSCDFDGFTGSELIRAVEAGYQESRYPTLKPIYEQFKVEHTDYYRNPLDSSGFTNFIYAANRLVLSHLKSKIDMFSVKKRFIQTYGHMEETERFINLAFERSIDKYL